MGRRPLLLATRSPDKRREIQEILAGWQHVELLTLDQLGIAPDPAEDEVEAFATFRENAIAKARYFAEKTGLPVLADDSGIEVDALQREPGVRSRRFAARPDLAGLALDLANNQLLLERLEQVPDHQRTARYVCAAVLLQPAPTTPRLTYRITTALGTVYGRILRAPRGSGGFGYDPLFLIPALGRTFAELAAGEKHRMSHRARALRALPEP